MEQYVALDVSLREISVCVIDAKGGVTFEGKVAAEPAALVRLIRAKAPQAVRVGLETGATQLTPQTVLSGSIGTGFAERSPAFRVVMGIQHTPSWPLLFR